MSVYTFKLAGACGVKQAAEDRGLNSHDVVDAFRKVGVEACVEVRGIGKHDAVKTSLHDLATPTDGEEPLMIKWVVPTGARDVSFVTKGGVGDVTMYIQKDFPPVVANGSTTYSHVSNNPGNSETVNIDVSSGGSYFILLTGTYHGVTLVGTYNQSDAGDVIAQGTDFNATERHGSDRGRYYSWTATTEIVSLVFEFWRYNVTTGTDVDLLVKHNVTAPWSGSDFRGTGSNPEIVEVKCRVRGGRYGIFLKKYGGNAGIGPWVLKVKHSNGFRKLTGVPATTAAPTTTTTEPPTTTTPPCPTFPSHHSHATTPSTQAPETNPPTTPPTTPPTNPPTTPPPTQAPSTEAPESSEESSEESGSGSGSGSGNGFSDQENGEDQPQGRSLDEELEEMLVERYLS